MKTAALGENAEPLQHTQFTGLPGTSACDMETEKKLTAHQALLLEMLKDFDAVCRKHKIRYQLFAGTALGAARHQGFIPWDDDVDVILTRAEYERFFREAAGDFDPERYYVQQEHGPHWPMQFSKLRRNHTACIEKYHPKDMAIHQGVYLDIFPCDRLSEKPLMQRIQFAASKAIIAKALYARGYETDSMAKKLFMQLCRLLPRRPLETLCMRKQDEQTRLYHSFLAAGKRFEKNILPRAWMEESVEAVFEDGVFPISAHYDALLTRLYGDWHVLPPPHERRCKEHAAILDLERPYTEYLEQQRRMEIAQYTRSIR